MMIFKIPLLIIICSIFISCKEKKSEQLFQDQNERVQQLRNAIRDSVLFVDINNMKLTKNVPELQDQVEFKQFARKICSPIRLLSLYRPDSSQLFKFLASLKNYVISGGIIVIQLNSHSIGYDSINGNRILLSDSKEIYTNKIAKYLCDSLLNFANVLFINATCNGILSRNVLEKPLNASPSQMAPDKCSLESDLSAEQYFKFIEYVEPIPTSKFNALLMNDNDEYVTLQIDSLCSKRDLDSVLIINTNKFYPNRYYHIGFTGILAPSPTGDATLTYFGKFLKGYSALESDFKLIDLYLFGKDYISTAPTNYYENHNPIEPFFYTLVFDTIKSNKDRITKEFLSQIVQIQRRIMIIRNNKTTP